MRPFPKFSEARKKWSEKYDTDLRGVGDIICWATDRVVGVRLIRLEFTVIAELHVDCSASELSHAGSVIIHHGRRSILVPHFKKRL